MIFNEFTSWLRAGRKKKKRLIFFRPHQKCTICSPWLLAVSSSVTVFTAGSCDSPFISFSLFLLAHISMSHLIVLFSLKFAYAMLSSVIYLPMCKFKVNTNVPVRALLYHWSPHFKTPHTFLFSVAEINQKTRQELRRNQQSKHLAASRAHIDTLSG